MAIRRVVPIFRGGNGGEVRDFYVGVLGRVPDVLAAVKGTAARRLRRP